MAKEFTNNLLIEFIAQKCMKKHVIIEGKGHYSSVDCFCERENMHNFYKWQKNDSIYIIEFLEKWLKHKQIKNPFISSLKASDKNTKDVLLMEAQKKIDTLTNELMEAQKKIDTLNEVIKDQKIQIDGFNEVMEVQKKIDVISMQMFKAHRKTMNRMNRTSTKVIKKG